MSSGLNSTVAAPNKSGFKPYRYTPSLEGAIITALIFATLSAFHLWRMLRARSFYFTPFLIGGVFQTVGYSARIWSHFDNENIGGYVIQATLILVAPALYAASIYMILARIIRVVEAEHHSLIPVKWLTKIFVTGDIISFTLQAGGGGIAGGGKLSLYDLGEKIIIAGLWVQIVVFGFFVTVSALFNTRLARSLTAPAARGIIDWKRHLFVLYTASGLILIRSIFRLVEYMQGNKGYLISHEIFLYMFDALLMIIVMVLFAVWYVGDLDQRSSYSKHDRESNSEDRMLDDLRYR